jgi:hypothetical protein
MPMLLSLLLLLLLLRGCAAVLRLSLKAHMVKLHRATNLV